MEKLLQNAIHSIEIGIEDFELSQKDERRIISCARNVFAGILLLFKYKLVELSPDNSDEVLIKQQIEWVIEDDQVVPKGKGKKTVDVKSIQDRFTSLNILVDWEKLSRVNSYRNDIEHYYSKLNIDAVQEMIANSFPIINDFIRNNLDENPENLFNKDIWLKLLSIKDVYEKEKILCDENLKELDFYHDEIFKIISNHVCSECGYSLIFADSTHNNHSANCVTYKCKSCNQAWSYDELIEECLHEKYKSEWLESHRDGGDSPVVDCPNCGGLYDYFGKICYSCGEEEIVEICERCGSNIPASELESSPFCGYCNYMLEKIRNE